MSSISSAPSQPMIKAARRTSLEDYKDTEPAHKLVTVPVSHYCERARWALDLAGVNYHEDMWPPVVHLLGTRWASRGKSKCVPILITTSDERVLDSGDILKWVARNYPEKTLQLYPQHLQEQVAKWEDLFSKRLGPMARVIAYHHLFQSSKEVMLGTVTWGTSGWRRRVFRIFAGPCIGLIKMGYKVNKKSAEICADKVRSIFAEVSGELSDGRPFLIAGSTAPTAADITFAALAAPLLNVPNYGGRLDIALPLSESEDWPGTALEVTRAGKHALRMYERYRIPREASNGRIA